MFAKAVELGSDVRAALLPRGLAYLRMGKLDEAVRTLETGSRIAASPGWGEGVLAFIAMRRGDPDEGARIVDNMVAQRQHKNVSPIGIAWALGAQGRADEAIEWLERASRSATRSSASCTSIRRGSRRPLIASRVRRDPGAARPRRCRRANALNGDRRPTPRFYGIAGGRRASRRNPRPARSSCRPLRSRQAASGASRRPGGRGSQSSKAGA